MHALAILSITAGLLMLATKTRRRFPCAAGAGAAMLAGGFYVSLPHVDAMGLFGWLWFCAWIVALPIMIACLVALIVILRRDRSVLFSTALCGFAIVAIIPPTVSYWEAAGLGVVHVEPTNKKPNKAALSTPAPLRVEFAMIVTTPTHCRVRTHGQV